MAILQRLGWHRWMKARVFWEDRIYLLTGEMSPVAFFHSAMPNCLTVLMVEFLKPGMRFVDAGAHIGYKAMLASVLAARQTCDSCLRRQ